MGLLVSGLSSFGQLLLVVAITLSSSSYLMNTLDEIPRTFAGELAGLSFICAWLFVVICIFFLPLAFLTNSA